MEKREYNDRDERRAERRTRGKERNPCREQREGEHASTERDRPVSAAEDRQREQAGISQKNKTKEKERLPREFWNCGNPKTEAKCRESRESCRRACPKHPMFFLLS